MHPSPGDMTDGFSTDPAGLPEARVASVVRLEDGAVLDLRVAPVAKRIGSAVTRMLAYNGSIPGPELRVPQGSEIAVRVTNEADHETTVHWHGLRLDNRFDGVPHETQALIGVGETFTYRVQFPDAGAFWYHPHVREDYAQEMGLYGTIVVEPSDPDYWSPVNREVTVTLDDVLIEDGRIAPFGRHRTDHTAMGRFGNVFLVNGEPQLAMEATSGEVIRLYLTNTANARVFNVGLPGARMKLVGGDNGRYEREEFVDEVLLAPSERAVLDVRFERPGRVAVEHRTPDGSHTLGWVTVTGERVARSFAEEFETLRRSPELESERAGIETDLRREPDKTLALVGLMPSMHAGGETPTGTDRSFTCPMHPEVGSDEPGRCPRCGMRLVPVEREPSASVHGHHGDGESDGIEWEDTMPEMNRDSTPDTMRWKLVDRATGLANDRIDWSFSVGDRLKIRLVNEMDSDHPMHHPIHFHGAGVFLVLSRNGAVEPNLVWKDTVLVRQGETVDILLYVTNPGVWMAHCHIAEHIEGGMMFSFRVNP